MGNAHSVGLGGIEVAHVLHFGELIDLAGLGHDGLIRRAPGGRSTRGPSVRSEEWSQ